MSTPTEVEISALRDAIGLSEASRRLGNMPFGAVLLSPDGAVLATAQNTVVTGRDLTGHAEINVLRAASGTCTAHQIAAATMVASGEPCPMCSGAMIRLGIRRVIFGIRAAIATPYLPATAGVLAVGLSCRDILRLAPASVEVMGPVLEDEARAPFEALAARGAG